jgi:hypothetical protein
LDDGLDDRQRAEAVGDRAADGIVGERGRPEARSSGRLGRGSELADPQHRPAAVDDLRPAPAPTSLAFTPIVTPPSYALGPS